MTTGDGAGRAEVSTRAMGDGDWDDVRRIYADGAATGVATFETEVASQEELDRRWHRDQRWVAVVGGKVAAWTAAMPISGRACYSGVAETSIYVDAAFRGRGIGRALIARQNDEADARGLWTLQTSIFVVNVVSIALHTSSGYRVVGTRERIAQRDGVWHDTVMLERRRAD